MSYIDVTVPMRNGMLNYPSVPRVEITKVFDMKQGDNGNLVRISFGTHTGTHYDPPFHMLIDGKRGDELPADYFIGKAKVFAFMSGEDIDLKDVENLDIQKGDMVLFKTPNGPHLLEDEFIEEYVTITPDAAANLVKKGIRAVGLDYLSVDKFGYNDTHLVFLKAGIPIVEGLYLVNVDPGLYKMTALFMHYKDSDGGPIRVLLEK
ncbi:MAG: cyclase family protein [Christensenellales bacterium]